MINHCLWYNQCGVQHVLDFLEGGGSLLEAARNAPNNSEELISFVESAVTASAFIDRALEGESQVTKTDWWIEQSSKKARQNYYN